MEKFNSLFSFLFQNRFIGYITSTIMMITAGTIYIFPVISVDLRNLLGYSLLEANFIFSCATFGNFVGILTGIFYDNFRTRFTSILASVLVCSSYTLIQLTCRGYLYNNSLLFGFYYLLVGFGGNAQVIIGSGTNSKNFPPERKGLVLGIVLLFFGLSGALLSPLYKFFEGPEKLANYYTMLSILGLFLPLINSIFLTEYEKPKEEEEFQEAKKPVANHDTSTLGMFITLRFYLVFLTWGVASGAGLMFMNNLGEIILSTGGPKDAATYLVPILLVSNCGGRVIGGLLLDIFGKWVSRPYFMLMTCAGALCASLLSAFSNFYMLFPAVVLQGFFFGVSMVVGVALPMDMFGPTYYGTNFSVCFAGPAIATLIFSTFMFSHIYSLNVPQDELKCTSGHHCYMWSFIIVAGCCLIGCILSLILALTTRKYYQKKQNNQQDKEIQENNNLIQSD
eukprot:gene10773-3392_t